MKKIVITCDRCGKEITGYPVRIFPEYKDRENDDILPDDMPFPECMEKIQDKDFCDSCAEKIVRYALGGMKVNPEFEKAVEEMVNDASPVPPKTDPEKDDKNPEADAVKEEKSGRKKIDTGKVMALTKAGWPVSQIAEELGVNAQAVYDARYRLKKEGKL